MDWNIQISTPEFHPRTRGDQMKPQIIERWVNGRWVYSGKVVSAFVADAAVKGLNENTDWKYRFRDAHQ